MLSILSPAKTMDYESPINLPSCTKPRLDDRTAVLLDAAQKLDVEELMKLMKISRPLAELNHERFQNFDRQPERQAIAAFDGDVYTGLDAHTMNQYGHRFAQKHTRILSGLYGLLRPLDAIRPYRLEMGTKRFPNDHKVSVWWESAIADLLAEDVEESGEATILNLASDEYYAGVKGRLPSGIRVVDIRFLDEDGRFITIHAKIMRGTMARWAIDNRIEKIADMKACTTRGYTFQADQSIQDQWVFRKTG